MVIDPSSQLNINTQSGKARVQTTASSTSTNTVNEATKQESSDVSLSSAGKSLVQLERSIQSAPDVDTNKANTLKASIEAGEYTVDSHAIADKMAQ